jgi:hypothetical protein
MTIEEAVAQVADVLNELGIPYMLVGAFSSNAYGVPRSTHDADFVAVVRAGEVSAIVDRLGPKFCLDPQIAFESAMGTTRYIIRYSDPPLPPFDIEFFRLSEDEFDQQRFARRQQATLLGRQTYLPTPEDVVVMKLRWFKALNRTKDYEDARSVLAVQGERLDWDYMHRWCDIHGTRGLLDQVRASIPPI